MKSENKNNNSTVLLYYITWYKGFLNILNTFNENAILNFHIWSLQDLTEFREFIRNSTANSINEIHNSTKREKKIPFPLILRNE